VGISLELRHLAKHYPGHAAVDGISLQIPQGGFFSLLGPSGCGKTTTLRLIAGFEEPTAGEVWLSGTLVNGRRPYERNVSTVFQNYALFPHLTAYANVEFGLRERGVRDRAGRVARVSQAAGRDRIESQRLRIQRWRDEVAVDVENQIRVIGREEAQTTIRSGRHNGRSGFHASINSIER